MNNSLAQRSEYNGNREELFMLVVRELSSVMYAQAAQWSSFLHTKETFESIKDTTGDHLARAAILIMAYMASKKWDVAPNVINFDGRTNLGARLFAITRIIVYSRDAPGFNQALAAIDLLCRDLKIDLLRHIEARLWYDENF